ncbi:unnamed protein product [Parascedosporium putredinis]|uniref:S-adenosyl-L-methionine-dependent methyltransferase n=1 Tax=Parascedosporium putredinis TaxID=1442378 RepID=A0A9P1H1Z5_9PEZI|nr:unnamed protein product [Parascedosporium putredinis]CAI7995633.1 unnamed protein product [Parascedosporium putredinis]
MGLARYRSLPSPSTILCKEPLLRLANPAPTTSHSTNLSASSQELSPTFPPPHANPSSVHHHHQSYQRPRLCYTTNRGVPARHPPPLLAIMNPAAEAIASTFRDVPPESHGPMWETLWTRNLTPWDRAGPSMPLHDLLADKSELLGAAAPGNKGRQGRKTALVPGCGKGHDVLLLSSWGYDVVGLDLAETALKEARENAEAVKNDEAYKLQDGHSKFDLIFDFTFSCALPMPLRPKWAARQAELLGPEGRLVILQFPNGKPLSLQGPPWGVNSDMYLALLSRPGEEIDIDEDGQVRHPDKIERAEGGLRRVDLYAPKRTHTIGVAEDGTITDRVSIWAH